VARLGNVFAPRDRVYFELFEEAGQNVLKASDLLDKLLATYPDSKGLEEDIVVCEHEGDRITHDIISRLNHTFVTPIDREDIQKLSAELDDVLDLTNSAARACALFGVTEPTTPMTQLIEILVKCTAEIEEVLPKLSKHDYPSLMETSRSIRQLEKDADGIFRSALSRLFKDAAVDAKELLREKEVLENLEHAIDRCERVAATLANLAVKHG